MNVCISIVYITNFGLGNTISHSLVLSLKYHFPVAINLHQIFPVAINLHQILDQSVCSWNVNVDCN